jgi:hypothetical protein
MVSTRPQPHRSDYRLQMLTVPIEPGMPKFWTYSVVIEANTNAVPRLQLRISALIYRGSTQSSFLSIYSPKALPRLSPASQMSHLYEPVLRYANFPTLDSGGEADRHSREFQEHCEVFDILKWLKADNHVQEIVKLRVPDRMYNSHDERESCNLCGSVSSSRP